jgi:membrane protease YdiL (CAAX protease family)
MGSQSKSFPFIRSLPELSAGVSRPRAKLLWMQLFLGYAPILAAVWTPEGPYKLALMLVATVLILSFAAAGPYSRKAMGLVIPEPRATLRILGFGIVLAAAVPLVARLLHANAVPIQPFVWRAVWQYSIWAQVQEFILLSFMFVRLESLLGGRRAVIGAAILFSLAHIPNPVLTIGTFIGGFLFCEMFRRFRSVLPIGIVHALLGLAIAVSFSSGIVHHMRVGIGYYAYHR